MKAQKKQWTGRLLLSVALAVGVVLLLWLTHLLPGGAAQSPPQPSSKTHVSSILQKLDLSSRYQVATYMRRIKG